MALDEPKENDEVFKDNGLTFVIDKELLNAVKPINVEFVESPRGNGFAVTSALTKKEKDDSCCGTCSC